MLKQLKTCQFKRKFSSPSYTLLDFLLKHPLYQQYTVKFCEIEKIVNFETNIIKIQDIHHPALFNIIHQKAFDKLKILAVLNRLLELSDRAGLSHNVPPVWQLSETLALITLIKKKSSKLDEKTESNLHLQKYL
ncbi:hypothetical protein BpHYR1_022621 [Brachionus plicatilis]|uniref:Uncharacterized protein n=1 Tax=Brachionus plicatilis TaxID=10195 RepID=A0A3M7RY03_BRAPC|nr:hypothetical protein BpHYR1_022621 [Brachionus plicatilis]